MPADPDFAYGNKIVGANSGPGNSYSSGHIKVSRAAVVAGLSRQELRQPASRGCHTWRTVPHYGGKHNWVTNSLLKRLAFVGEVYTLA
jgi:hypothetical protein